MLNLIRLITVVIGLSASLAHSAKETLQVAYTEFPPYTFTADNGEPAGVFVDVFQKTAAAAGYPIRLFSLPNARTYYLLKRGEIDIWLGAAKVPDLLDHVLEVPVEPMAITLNLWYMEGTPPVNSMHDIKGESLIVINGFTYAGLVDKAIAEGASFHAVKSSGHSSAIHMLVSGRARYMLDYVEPVQVVLAEAPVTGLHSRTIWKQGLAVVISKQGRNTLQIQSDLTQAFMSLRGKPPDMQLASPDETSLKSIRLQSGGD